MDTINNIDKIGNQPEMYPSHKNLIKNSKNDKTVDYNNLQFEKAFKKARQYVNINNTRISLSYDQENREPIIYVLDNETDEVIRRIPPEKLIEISGDEEKLKGFFVEKDI